MATASFSQYLADIADMMESMEAFTNIHRKSFEAEDGAALLRTYTSPQPAYQRYSLALPHQLSTSGLSGLASSSASLLGEEDLESIDNFSLPRCASESNFMQSPKTAVEVKRNHSLKTFLQKKIPPSIRRTKSSKINQGKENRPVLDMTSLMAQGGNLRNTEVDLPFYMPPIEIPDVIDLSNCATEFHDAVVRPLHHSILGRNHCFEIITDEGSRCFGCESAGEREAWIEKIKRAINPNLDNSRRTEHQLTLFVQEAKGLPSKKKYFCEICLDRKLCARTTSKLKNDCTIFWGEHFDFTSMPSILDITVHLYKDSDRKKKKDKDYIGLVNLPAQSLLNQQSLEKWYNLSTPSGNNKSKTGEAMALRIKAKFVSVAVLPTEQYKALGEHISRNYLPMCRSLGNVISVSRKDELARILVSIMYGIGCIKDFMTDLVMDEVDKVEEESLIFRENTIGTKSVEAVLRLVGMKYLDDTLGDFITALFNMEEECEVDGSRLPPHASLEVNQKNLHMSCEIALCKIVSSVGIFPSELREVMATWRIRCEAAGKPRIANRLVTASLFLRLLCPAIFNPNLFGLANEVPDAKVSRTLTLIAKVIQNLANRSRFGNKEEYMQFMDVFVREKWDDMGSFIDNVSDPSLPPLNKGFKGFIDLGKEFAKLHAFFVELLPTLDKKTVEDLGELPSILDRISEALAKPIPATSSTSLRPISSEPLSLAQIVEGVAVSQDADNVIHPGCSSTPMGDRRSFHPAAGTSSLLDLRDYINAHEDGDADAPPAAVPNRFSPVHHGSHPSLPITCSFNNSNNTSWNRQTLSSTENLITSSSTSAPHREDRPLMFSNPAYHMPKHSSAAPTSLSAMHDALNLPAQSGLRNTASSEGRSSDVSHPPRDVKYRAPLSFSNPLQSLNNQRHLETVFTTETVTYSAPTRYMIGAPSRGYAGLREEVFTSSDGSHSNDSSLSTRQSSTTTDTHSNPNHDSSLGVVEQPTILSSPQNKSLRSTTDHATNQRINSAESDREVAEDDHLLVSAEMITSVSNAHLKTGLQSHNQSRPTHKVPDSSPYKPQPKPRTNLSSVHRDDVTNRKVSAPAMSTRHKVNPPMRRASADVVRPSADETKYPSFHLSKQDHDVILELGESTVEVDQGRVKDAPNALSKDQDGFVTAPVAAVKSRVVVSTSNANKVKTSKHAPQHKPYQPAQSSRRSSHQKVGMPKSASQSSLPPSTPEGQLSPQARTAQWILNVPTPKPEESVEMAMTPKDYEDRIIRLEAEVERLRACAVDGEELQREFDKREALLLEKIRNSEKRESRMRRQAADKDEEMERVLQRLNQLESERQKEREEMRAMMSNREADLIEKQKMINKLERKLQRAKRSGFSQEPGAPPPLSYRRADDLGGNISYIDDDAEMEQRNIRSRQTHSKFPPSSVPGGVESFCNGQSPVPLPSGSTSSV